MNDELFHYIHKLSEDLIKHIENLINDFEEILKNDQKNEK